MGDPHWEPKEQHRLVEPLFGGLEDAGKTPAEPGGAEAGDGRSGEGSETEPRAGRTALVVAAGALALAALAWALLG